MKVAVTGGAGFVGSHVRDVLIEGHHDAVVFDRISSVALELSPETPVELSEEEYSFLGFDAVIHLAAYADISRNWESRDERDKLYRDNVKALIRVLESTPPNIPFVFVSSAAVDYSDSPYAATKAFGERLVKSYFPKYGKIIRLVSCVGARYSHGHIKDFVETFKRGGALVPKDNGYSPKSFVHVRDAAEAIVRKITNRVVYESIHTVAAGSWSWRDTLAMMGMRAERWEDKRAGWRGDPVGLRVDSDWACKRSVGEGVREALISLGWQW